MEVYRMPTGLVVATAYTTTHCSSKFTNMAPV